MTISSSLGISWFPNYANRATLRRSSHMGGRYRPQELSIAISHEDTRLVICQFEFGMRNRINAVERLASASKHFVFALASDESRSVGVTPTGHLKLPPKLPRKCPAAPDPRRSLATIVCRLIRVRYTCFSGVLTRMPSLPDRCRSSPNIANWWARSDSNRGPRDSLLPRRFRREWTISSPTWGAGRSSLSLSAACTRSGSLCTFRRCTAGLAQGCHQLAAGQVSLNSSRPLRTLRC